MDALDMARYLGALFITLALLGLFLVALKRFGPFLGLERFGLTRASAGGRRLQVVESVMLDARRRVVIVRADGREHLLLLGATGEAVIESRDARDPEAAA